LSISHERIYQYVLADKKSGGTLYQHLRHSNKKRKKRYGSHDRRGQLKNRISIDERPKIVDKKTRIGDWEIDTVIGKNHKGALVTIVDRVSKVTVIEKVATKHADGVTDATIKGLLPYIVHTITGDNGKEFAGHEWIAKALDTNFYFAHPYSSWQRGCNENTNGLIRQYVPKGSSFDHLTNKDAKKIMGRLNNRPRKSLGYRTPNEFSFERTGRIAA
jgi:IS30 family transposase